LNLGWCHNFQFSQLIFNLISLLRAAKKVAAALTAGKASSATNLEDNEDGIDMTAKQVGLFVDQVRHFRDWGVFAREAASAAKKALSLAFKGISVAGKAACAASEAVNHGFATAASKHMVLFAPYGYRIRTWGDTCGGIRELAVKDI
jgi:hypothetical protein